MRLYEKEIFQTTLPMPKYVDKKLGGFQVRFLLLKVNSYQVYNKIITFACGQINVPKLSGWRYPNYYC
jgi:hypothetical protein